MNSIFFSIKIDSIRTYKLKSYHIISNMFIGLPEACINWLINTFQLSNYLTRVQTHQYFSIISLKHNFKHW
jgi:hypothetical protein